MSALANRIALLGVVLPSVLLFWVRLFASRHGLEVHWLSRSLQRERQHLRVLARGQDRRLAEGARFHLRLEILAWAVFIGCMLAFIVLKVSA